MANKAKQLLMQIKPDEPAGLPPKSDWIRRVIIPGSYRDSPDYALILYWPDNPRATASHEYIGYVLYQIGGPIIFKGEDYGLPFGSDASSDASVRGILNFLTLRPGDVEDDYFEKYTPEQHEFVDREAEMMSVYGMEPQADDEYKTELKDLPFDPDEE